MARIGLIALGIAGLGCSMANPEWSFAQVQGGTTVVTAPDLEPSFTRAVPYGDLNLSTAHGEHQLQRRVRGAVKSVCLEATGPSPFFYVEMSCRKATWRDVRPSMELVLQRARLGQLKSGATAAATILVSAAP